MQGSAVRQGSIVNLDDYRRARHGRTDARPMQPSTATQSPPPMWVYWVPVWIW